MMQVERMRQIKLSGNPAVGGMAGRANRAEQSGMISRVSMTAITNGRGSLEDNAIWTGDMAAGARQTLVPAGQRERRF